MELFSNRDLFGRLFGVLGVWRKVWGGSDAQFLFWSVGFMFVGFYIIGFYTVSIILVVFLMLAIMNPYIMMAIVNPGLN